MPIRHRMKLAPENYERVRLGQQKYELRLNDEKRQALKVGERVEFAKLPELEHSVIAEITSLQVFKNFDQAVEQVTEATGDLTAEDFLFKLRSYYTPSEEAKYGVVVIGLLLV